MKKKILIMGLPGSGKTHLAKKISNILKADWLNADKIRVKIQRLGFQHKRDYKTSTPNEKFGR